MRESFPNPLQGLFYFRKMTKGLEKLGGNATMSSREIAELTGKRHDHVLRDCDELNSNYLKMNIPQIWVMEEEHPTVKGRKIRVLYLTKMQTFDLMTGYSIELRIKVNRRWEELETKEKSHQLPQTFAEALQLAADQAKKLELQEAKIQNDAPKVELYEKLMDSDVAISIGQFAKLSNIKGMGQNKLFKKLREDNVFGNSKNRNLNSPYQRYIDSGYFEVKETVIDLSEDKQIVKTQPLVTPKGQEWLLNKYKYFEWTTFKA